MPGGCQTSTQKGFYKKFIYCFLIDLTIFRTCRVLKTDKQDIRRHQSMSFSSPMYYRFWLLRRVWRAQMFELLYDDKITLLRTIGYAYHPLLRILLLSGWSILLFWLWQWLYKNIFLLRVLTKAHRKSSRRAVVFLIILLTILGARGTLKTRPIKRTWTYVSSDPLLNKTIINPDGPGISGRR